MSIATMINWNRKYSMGIDDLISYLWASSKTRGERYTGTNNLLTHMPAMEMNALKKLYHKPGGRQWGHLAVSLTPDNEDRNSYAYLLQSGWQCHCFMIISASFAFIQIPISGIFTLPGTAYPASTDINTLSANMSFT